MLFRSPIGLTALLAAKMLNLHTSGIYHTDFPQYVRILTEDSFLESVTWRYMHWFYGQLDTVFVNSEEYRESWIKRGFDPAKLEIFPRGLDTELFHPTRRDPAFFEKFGSTWWETTWKVVLPAARPGIFGAVILSLGRALGETIAVTMVIGNRPEIQGSLLKPAETLASVIANEFAESTGKIYPAALMEIGLVLMAVTLVINVLALLLVRSVAE